MKTTQWIFTKGGAQRDNFLVVTDADNAWKQWAGYSAPDDAYIVLINKSGQPIWNTTARSTKLR